MKWCDQLRLACSEGVSLSRIKIGILWLEWQEGEKSNDFKPIDKAIVRDGEQVTRP